MVYSALALALFGYTPLALYTKEVLMNNKIDAVLSMATALLLAFTVTLTSCPVVSAVGEPSPAQPWNPVIPLWPITFGPPYDPPMFAFFYLDGKEPSVNDTGRTGFMAVNVPMAKRLLIVSEDVETADTDVEPADPIVYFYGIEGISSAAFEFARGEEKDFPERFVIHPEDGTVTTAEFSAYDEETSTFSVTISEGENATTTDEGLVLNSGVFSVYENDKTLSESQNLRIKNIVTSLALWTSLAYQTEIAAAVEVAAVNVIDCLIEAIAFVSPYSPGIAVAGGAFATSMAAVVEGVAVASGNAAKYFAEAAAAMEDSPSDSTEPAAPPYTGDPGPEGGVLFKVAYTDGYRWFEAAPNDLGIAEMKDGEAEAVCAAYSTSPDGKKDWFLPDFTQLNYIYSLYKKGKLDCEPAGIYWSSTTHQATDSFTQHYSAMDFFYGETNRWILPSNIHCYVIPIRAVSTEELEVLYPGS
jgi:hypothetical protein